MWEKIWNLEKSDLVAPNKFPNWRSEFLLQVNDKQLKLKRNQYYKDILRQTQQFNSHSDKHKESKDNE